MDIFITNSWNNYLNLFSPETKDIYYFEEYVNLYKSAQEEPLCMVALENDKCMLFPFLQREFQYCNKKYYDFETPYGYGGPIFNVYDETFINNSLRKLFHEFTQNNYIAGFVRFHPLLQNYSQFDTIGQIIFDRKTIAIDISLPEEDIWMKEIHTKNRNVIKKAQKNGLEFIVDNEFEHLSQFISLYDSTMNKLSADDFYYFKDTYYTSLKNTLRNSFLGLVKKEETLLSAAIFFYCGPYGHYHLSGSNQDFLNLSPNNFMIYKAAIELKSRGVKHFHLGGGTTSNENDSLFCFKSRFSNHQYQFVIGKLIFNPTIYQILCDNWMKRYPEKVDHYKHFLLKYKY